MHTTPLLLVSLLKVKVNHISVIPITAFCWTVSHLYHIYLMGPSTETVLHSVTISESSMLNKTEFLCSSPSAMGVTATL